jgi:hypothetical protein
MKFNHDKKYQLFDSAHFINKDKHLSSTNQREIDKNYLITFFTCKFPHLEARRICLLIMLLMIKKRQSLISEEIFL